MPFTVEAVFPERACGVISLIKISLLSTKIKDQRFLRLIRKYLKYSFLRKIISLGNVVKIGKLLSFDDIREEPPFDSSYQEKSRTNTNS